MTSTALAAGGMGDEAVGAAAGGFLDIGRPWFGSERAYSGTSGRASNTRSERPEPTDSEMHADAGQVVGVSLVVGRIKAAVVAAARVGR